MANLNMLRDVEKGRPVSRAKKEFNKSLRSDKKHNDF